jgi:hypothetical protein
MKKYAGGSGRRWRAAEAAGGDGSAVEPQPSRSAAAHARSVFRDVL